MPADARGRGAAVLGSRSFRRQVNAVVAAATAARAYSVGFGVVRGTLTGLNRVYRVPVGRLRWRAHRYTFGHGSFKRRAVFVASGFDGCERAAFGARPRRLDCAGFAGCGSQARV